MLERLDALIVKESQMMAVQTLEVVYGLVTGTRGIIDGAHWLFTRLRACYLTPLSLRSWRLEATN